LPSISRQVQDHDFALDLNQGGLTGYRVRHGFPSVLNDVFAAFVLGSVESGFSYCYIDSPNRGTNESVRAPGAE
jgi:hypothetical protein